MGRRCEDIKCPYLATDGSCLMPNIERAEHCPARESVRREEKDTWITDIQFVQVNGNPSKRRR